jgi:hypothetical protein
MRGRVQLAGPPQHVEVETRDLGSYDRLFKLIDGAGRDAFFRLICR